MTEKEINEVAVMRRAGNSNREIAETLGISYDRVVRCVSQARKRNLLPPKPKAEPRQAVRDFVNNYGKRQGRISHVMIALSKEQRLWVMREVTKLECDSVAEYITELVRDEYERANHNG